MSTEKIEEVPTGILLRRKKFILVLAGIFTGVSILMLALIIYDLLNGRDIKASLSGLVPALAGFWIPLMMLSKVNKELNKRKSD